jgi:hypothetical protein
MPIVPTGFIHQGHLDAAIKITIGSLGPEVAHVAYSIGPDSTGEPSIFFRILLSDPYIREDTIADLTRRIATILSDGATYRELGLTAILQLQKQIRTGPPPRS